MADAPKNKEWNQNYPSVFISEIKVTKLFLGFASEEIQDFATRCFDARKRYKFHMWTVALISITIFRIFFYRYFNTVPLFFSPSVCF